MHSHRLAILTVLFLLAASRPLPAAGVPLSAELEPLSSTARVGAPVPIVWRLIWNGAGLLEGHLHLTIRDQTDVVARVRIEDLVVTGSEQRFRAMLPPVVSNNRYGELTIRAVFEENGRTIDLGEHLLRVPGQWQRWFGLCLCAPWDLADHPALRTLAGELQIEQFHPDRDPQTSALAAREIGTSIASVSPEAMPAEPLTYCACNLVVLDAAGFAEMRANQLDVLRQWVDAGGSVCVFAAGNLSPAHVDLLNDLAGDPGTPPYLLDSQGRLMNLDDADDRLRLARYGLGRVAILRGTPEDWQNIEPEQWREAAAWLWRVRQDQHRSFIEEGMWDARRVRPAVQEWGGPVARPGQPMPLMALSPAPLQSGHQLLNRLMPENVEVVPLELIGLILFVYLLLIGPADYFLLGWLRQRKLTWIAFPAVTVGVTLLTVWLSHAYMDTPADRQAVVFVDIGQQGTAARTSRYELLFTGTAHEMRTEMKHALLTPLDHQRLGGVVFDPRFGFQQNQSTDLLVGPARYAGRVPLRYTVAQDVPQWTPQINRQFAVSPDISLPKIDWTAIAPRQLLSPGGRAAAEQRLRDAFGPSATIYLLNGQEMHRISGQTHLFPDERYTYTPQGFAVALPDSRPTNFLQETSVPNQMGLFSIISGTAPAGGSSFEDLPILDPSNPNEWLLVIAVDHGDELVIYRKLYVEETGGRSSR